MTSYTKLCTPLNISEAFPCTLMYCIMDSADCATLHCPLYPCPHTCQFFVCLFILVHWCHMLLALFVYFSLQIVSILDRQWIDAKSDCTHCIRRGLSRRLRSSLLLNSSPSSTSRDTSLRQLAETCWSLTLCLSS